MFGVVGDDSMFEFRRSRSNSWLTLGAGPETGMGWGSRGAGLLHQTEGDTDLRMAVRGRPCCHSAKGKAVSDLG
jgi:hypothetical protein